MKFIVLPLAILAMISNVWGLAEEVTYNSNKYYSFNGNLIIENYLPLTVAPNQQANGIIQNGYVFTLHCKNDTNNILRIWNGMEGLVTFQPNEQKSISWHRANPLMVLARDDSAHLDGQVYLQVLHSKNPR
ncbi:hypothetical protein PGT21_004149 [Puccinia graminis f. sp. tritici]|uniref:Cell wall alpha-1,3-glucan synthase ags1 n=2 Tax=Puccinia graminis f. sp. tritici TaxID=56615 RepID=E3JTN8_PUCGT|nr:uncharacterized protein PGTG_00762 [Puccinia graminis f. sp. tritici CRL 75-36-700-3]EFP75431.1 hypothetical protein PGTG_00762 [Puccinia graminis f. sp. tritici CRL 75-36-700-3]KAA1116194.1 hypothetical protein PGT21_004149 [Puccinia graminis f. sp. tritici]